MTAFEKLHGIYKTQEGIAKAFKVTRQTIGLWKRDGVPAIRAAEVEKVTKGKVTILDVIKG
jgi:GTP1/Obg family GTP-binding protein